MQTKNFTFQDVETDKPVTTTVKVEAVENGLFIQPAGTGTWDGDYAPILLEIVNGTPFLYVWADINQEDFTHKIDLTGALESSRKPDQENA